MAVRLAAGLSVVLALAAPPASRADPKHPIEQRVQTCAACHNPDGNSTIHDNPKVAGLHADYFVKQLRDFKSGTRKSPIMNTLIASVPEEDFKEIAEYFSAQKPSPGQATDASLVPRGKTIYNDGIVATAVPACAGCHNEDGSGTPKYPRLAAQHAAYTIRQMQNFKSGERANDARGVMSAVAKRMNEEEIRAVAQYIATLTGRREIEEEEEEEEEEAEEKGRRRGGKTEP